ncbi:MAG: hypothetical protein IKA56_00845 [Clostridia bacterium]|nr:hypothetical protein [Clostridia bacterium]
MEDFKCPLCGNPVERDIRRCPSCNADLYEMWQNMYYENVDKRYTYTEPAGRSNTLCKLESFFCPPYGLILYFTLKNEDRPQKAKMVLDAALKGIGLYASIGVGMLIASNLM